MTKQVETKQAAAPANKQAVASQKVWELVAPSGLKYRTSNEAEAKNLIFTRGYRESK